MRRLCWILPALPIGIGIFFLLPREGEEDKPPPAEFCGTTLPDPVAVEDPNPVVEIKGEPDPSPRWIETRPPERLEELRRLANSPYVPIRAWALLIASIPDGPEAVRQAVALGQKTVDPTIRRFLAQLMEGVQDDGALALLAQYVRAEEDAELRLVSAQVLARQGSSLLDVAKRETDPQVSAVAVDSLNIESLDQLIRDPSAANLGRGLAIHRLAERDPARLQHGYSMLDDGLRRVAIESVSHQMDGIGGLFSKEPSALLRAHAVDQAARRLGPKAREWLEQVVLQDPSDLVAREAQKSLQRLR
jgi:hypothetical protein